MIKEIDREELVFRLRQWIDLTEDVAGDEELLQATQRTFGFARVRLGMAIEEFKKDIISKLEEIRLAIKELTLRMRW